MKTEHTSEPWRVGRRGNDVVGSNGLGDTVAMMIDCDSDEQTHANARRIVACVNACEGIGTEYLEHFGGTSFNDFKRVKGQRDELLAALESNQSRGVRDVIVERRRQINIEGWSSHHDDQHSYGEMALAAGCYAMFGLCFNAGDPPKYWPWDKKWWKPSDKRRNLVKAAALIIAEIERIDRAAIAIVKGGA